MKKTILIILIIILNNVVYPQKQVDLDPYIFLDNIKQKVFKVKRQQGFDDIYVDLNSKSYIKPGSFNNEKEEVFVEFDFQIYEGSFINKSALEYLFIIKLPENSFVYFFCHAENFGNTTMIYIFDSIYNQLSKVAFKDRSTNLIDILDIDNDGIDEVFMKSYYACNSGIFITYLIIFSRNFNDSKLEIIIGLNAEISGVSGERITLKSDYSIEDGMLVLNSKLDYYICMGRNEDDTPDNRFYKTEYKRDVFEYKNGKFYHIKGENNVNWNDSRLEF